MFADIPDAGLPRGLSHTVQRGRPIDLVAPPFAGHLHPLLGIGVDLQARTPRCVRVISTAAARPAIEASGLTAITLLEGADDEVNAIANPEARVRTNPARLLAQLRANLALMGRFRDEIDALYRVEPPCLALVDFTVPVAGFAALAAGARWWTALPSPCAIDTVIGTPSYLGGWMPAVGPLDRLRDSVGRAGVRGFKRAVVHLNRGQLRDLGIDHPFRRDGTEVIYSEDRIFALGLQELEFERSWPASLEFTGPVLFSPPVPFGATADEQVVSVVPGARNVLLTLGTQLPGYRRLALTEFRLLAVALPDVQFQFSAGDEVSASALEGLPANLRVVRSVSYRALDRFDLVVHHGGAGVMYSTIAAGVPALVHPIDYDQFDNAARLVQAGLAVRVRTLAELPALVRASLNGPGAAQTHQRFQALALQSRGPVAITDAMCEAVSSTT